MIKDYIINAAVLVAFISVIFQGFRNTGINPSLSLSKRILSGCIFGLLGMTLLIFSIHLPNNVLIDFRYLAIILSTISGGWVSSVFSGLIITIFRILLFGIDKSSIVAAIALLILTAIYCIIIRFKIKKYYLWLLMVSLTEVVSSITYSIEVNDFRLQNEIILYSSLGFAIVSVFLYFFVEYINMVTESYRILSFEANKDFLTGLNNVRYFDTVYNRAIEHTKSTHGKLSLLYIDIDFFKKVNDIYGHKDGDLVLKHLGKIFLETCRHIDIVSRNGGEEFSIILIDCTPAMAMEIAERLRKNVENSFIELSNNKKVKVTISVGVASYPDPITDLDALREKADGALYKAKRSGRNKVELSQ